MRPQLPYLSESAVCQTKRSGSSRIKKDDRLHLTKNKTRTSSLYVHMGGQHDSCCRGRSCRACVDNAVHRHDCSLGRGIVVGVMTVGISCQIARHTKLCMTQSGPA